MFGDDALDRVLKKRHVSGICLHKSAGRFLVKLLDRFLFKLQTTGGVLNDDSEKIEAGVYTLCSKVQFQFVRTLVTEARVTKPIFTYPAKGLLRNDTAKCFAIALVEYVAAEILDASGAEAKTNAGPSGDEVEIAVEHIESGIAGKPELMALRESIELAMPGEEDEEETFDDIDKVELSDAQKQSLSSTDVLPEYVPFSEGPPHVSKLCEAAMTQFASHKGGGADRGGMTCPEQLIFDVFEAPASARWTDLLHERLRSCPALSAAQRDAIAMARLRHERGYAFVIADGTGCGKGREGVGIVLNAMLKDNCCRAIYFSVKATLESLQRDVDDLHPLSDIIKPPSRGGMFSLLYLPRNGVHDVRECKATLPDKGIIFVPYTSIGAEAGNKTLARLKAWVQEGRPGTASIVLDESHKVTKIWGPKPSKTGQRMDQFLQEMRGSCHITFMSATFASCLDDLKVYAPHLGLVGPDFLSFEALKGQLDNRAEAGALELLNAELVHSQSLIARQLSFQGVHFSTMKVSLDAEYKAMHSKASQVWQDIIELVCEIEGDGARQLKGLLWSAHQRFWKALILCGKVGRCVELANAELKNENAVVISLQYTGEAAAKREAARVDDDDDNDDSNCLVLDTLLQFLEKMKETASHYGIALDPKVVDAIAIDAKELSLPEAAPLDLLKSGLGGSEKVAELTARKHFMEKNPSTGRWEQVVNRTGFASETEAFQSGGKRVAVLSTAGSTGISLHAERDGARQRVQILFELPWSSVQCMQQLGRVHRSNQHHTPRYVILAAEFGPDLRFAATVASRLQSLGAISSGDRTTIEDGAHIRIEGANVEADLLVSKHGDAAATSLAKSALGPTHTVLESAGLLASDKVIFTSSKQFLNRLLGMPISDAQGVFDEFEDRVQRVRDEAERKGRATEEPIMQITVDDVKVKLSRELECGGSLSVSILSSDRGLSFAEARATQQALLSNGNTDNDVYWSADSGGCLVFRRTRTTGRKYTPAGWQPYRARSADRWPAKTRAGPYFQKRWNEAFAQGEGKAPRVETVNVAKLSALPVLKVLFTGSEKPQMARVTKKDGSKFVGLVISDKQMVAVHRKHQAHESTVDLDLLSDNEDDRASMGGDLSDAGSIPALGADVQMQTLIDEAREERALADADTDNPDAAEPNAPAAVVEPVAIRVVEPVAIPVEEPVGEPVVQPDAEPSQSRKRPREDEATDSGHGLLQPQCGRTAASFSSEAGQMHGTSAPQQDVGTSAPPLDLLARVNLGLDEAKSTAITKRSQKLQELIDQTEPSNLTGSKVLELLGHVEADMARHYYFQARLLTAASTLASAQADAEEALTAWLGYETTGLGVEEWD